MLSIIISSYQEKYYTALEKNIAETCGIEYEVIRIVNRNEMSLTSAYNKGANMAKYDNLLFIHEDIKFHTKDWGQILINHLKDKHTGVVGVAGSDYVPSAPTGWLLFFDRFRYVHIIQSDAKANAPSITHILPEKSKVFAMDGVFLASSKAHYLQVKFNEELPGFHGYDIDFTLRAAKKYQNYVINDILIEHFSLGSFDKEFFDANIKVRKNVGNKFPFKKISMIERDFFQKFILKYFEYYDVTFRNIIRTLQFFPRLGFLDFVSVLKTYLYLIFKNRSGVTRL